jgi:rSAM/selenodomain-associated transferase 2
VISIIIPTYNESETIAALIHHLQAEDTGLVSEIIVADGGSTDDTVTLATTAGAVVIQSPVKARSAQMNYGAARATGEVLYFVHADTLPPRNFSRDIMEQIAKGKTIGRFCTRFRSNRLLLRFNAFFTRFDWFVCYGGDQTLYISRQLFCNLNGYNENMRIMEEYDLTSRARKQAAYGIIRKPVLISARKYETNTWWQVQKANYTVVRMYRKNASQEEMVNTYRKMLNYR